MKRSVHLFPLLDMLCLHCTRFSDTLLCPACSKALEQASYASLYEQRCPTCNRPVADRAYPCPFCRDGVQAYAPYTGIVATLLNQFKAGQQKALAKILAPLYIPMLSPLEKPLLIPIPASRKGYAERGFDQMLLTTGILKKKTGYPALPLFVQKGEGQSKFLSRAERQRRHTITLLPLDAKVEKLHQGGHTFVLLDDICTSGSTLEHTKALLYQSHGIRALALVIALA